MSLTDAQVAAIKVTNTAAQTPVQGRFPVNVAFTAVANRCIGHMILSEIATWTAAQRKEAFGLGAPTDPLVNRESAEWYLRKIESLTFRGAVDISWKTSASATDEVTMVLADHAVNEPFTEWWRCYFGATVGATLVTIAV